MSRLPGSKPANVPYPDEPSASIPFNTASNTLRAHTAHAQLAASSTPASLGKASARDAAIVMMSIDDSLARLVLAHLDRGDVETLNREMARLGRVDEQTQSQVLDAFYQECMRRQRFTFDDLAQLDDHAIRAAYDDVDARAWALALTGSARALVQRVLQAIAPADEQLRSQIKSLGPFRVDEVEASQNLLLDRLRQLHDEGVITLPQLPAHEPIIV